MRNYSGEASTSLPQNTGLATTLPITDGAIIQHHVEHAITDTAIAFSIHDQRLLDNRSAGTTFKLDGEEGNAWTEREVTFFLLPYWMARYHGLLK